MTYYITVPSGMQHVAADALTGKAASGGTAVADRIISLLDGAVLFSSSFSPNRIAGLTFVQNAFYVVRGIRSESGRRRNSGRGTRRTRRPSTSSMNRLVQTALTLSFDRTQLPRQLLHGCRSVRVVTSSGNQLVAVDRRSRGELEHALSRSLNLTLRPGGADLELWIIQRTEGSGIIGFRLTTRRATERDLGKGELRPELANLLCHLSNPGPDDRFLDPFCGSGAIAVERARMAAVSQLYACDSDASLVGRTSTRLAKVTSGQKGHTKAVPSVSVRQCDARDLRFLDAGSVTSVVTDPPWGAYETAINDLVGLYRGFVRELARVVAPTGRVVLLVGRDGPMGEILDAAPDFSRCTSTDILVQGKKATVLVAQRD